MRKISVFSVKTANVDFVEHRTEWSAKEEKEILGPAYKLYGLCQSFMSRVPNEVIDIFDLKAVNSIQGGEVVMEVYAVFEDVDEAVVSEIIQCIKEELEEAIKLVERVVEIGEYNSEKVVIVYDNYASDLVVKAKSESIANLANKMRKIISGYDLEIAFSERKYNIFYKERGGKFQDEKRVRRVVKVDGVSKRNSKVEVTEDHKKYSWLHCRQEDYSALNAAYNNDNFVEVWVLPIYKYQAGHLHEDGGEIVQVGEVTQGEINFNTD
ncbi:hypothetical protein [Spongiibacter marinus]|uniref:hypothetical protein n=1 Tax=Spongiibacter marinus TaxID=354246 RepID=UPI0035BE6614